MKRNTFTTLMVVTLLATATLARAADSTTPIVAADLVFEESDGVAAVEAEHFCKQTLTDKRAWHITSSASVPELTPDADPAHVAGASGGAYVEILPDTRATHGHKLIHGENFSANPGVLAVLHYKVHFNQPGRYYVWVRAHSTGSEDNGVHVGLDGKWPESGQRWQTVQKKKWGWECRQRTETVHAGVPMQLFLDIDEAGEHEILFSLREDGFEMDKFVLASRRDFRPEGKGPTIKVKSGEPPPPFAETEASASAARDYPKHWGPPPQVQTMDYLPLPGGYGHGSSTLAKWIQSRLDQDAASLKLEAASFELNGTGYYLDKGKWAAINPQRNESATAKRAFPFPSGRYDVTLQAVGEADGESTYSVAVNDRKIGDHECPIAPSAMEEGVAYHKTWKNQEVESGDIIAVSSTIASADGKEYSRARWARITFAPANDATKAAVANVEASKSEVPPAPAPAALVQPRNPDGKGTVEISGELKQWHKVTLTLDGLFAHELDNEPNPFTDDNFTVTFTHESGVPSYKVPGYFAADGNAGETAAESGTKWRAHLAPDKAGVWKYSVSFTRGKHAALDGGGEAVKPFEGVSGSFKIARTDKKGRDFRAKGRLEYVGKRYLQFVDSKEWFLKVGADAPETLLGYADFDNTVAHKPGKVPLKTWKAHIQDWNEGDPTWQNGKGKGLIGAINYLSAKGANAFSFLTYNAGGDGDNVWPHVSRDDKLHFDCSKLDQWGVVFSHGTAKGMYLHFKLQETENDDLRSKDPVGPDQALDGGKCGPQRKAYLREMIARYGHNLALNWNLGEENTQTLDELESMIFYIRKTDPYGHNRVLHTYPNEQDKVYGWFVGRKNMLSGVSIQNSDVANTHIDTLKWVTRSEASGHPWAVAFDEAGNAQAGTPPDPDWPGMAEALERIKVGKWKGKVPTIHDIRAEVLWGTLMAGGYGVEYYFGYQLPENDLLAENWRSREKTWDYSRIALQFFANNDVPFWQMTNANALVGNLKDDNTRYCLAKPGEVYLVYLTQGGAGELDLTGAQGEFAVKWFNPRQGGALKEGAIRTVTGGGRVTLGLPPVEPAEDWLAVVRR